MSRTVLTAKGIKKRYVMGGDTLDVLMGVDLDLCEGEILAIVGESGAGKSTLLHILGMLDRPSDGTLMLDGNVITGMSDTELAYHRNRTVGFSKLMPLRSRLTSAKSRVVNTLPCRSR